MTQVSQQFKNSSKFSEFWVPIQLEYYTYVQIVDAASTVVVEADDFRLQ